MLLLVNLEVVGGEGEVGVGEEENNG